MEYKSDVSQESCWLLQPFLEIFHTVQQEICFILLVHWRYDCFCFLNITKMKQKRILITVLDEPEIREDAFEKQRSYWTRIHWKYFMPCT